MTATILTSTTELLTSTFQTTMDSLLIPLSVPSLLADAPFGAAAALGGIALLAVVTIIMVVRNLLYVCGPNEVLVFSGRPRKSVTGTIGYRVIRGGSALRIPLLETVDHMDLTNMNIEVKVEGAYSLGGIPLNIQGIANIKVPGEEPLLNNTLERFLGRSREEIMKAARETLEGNLRGVLSTMTPEDVNRDKNVFAQNLIKEAGEDMRQLGLVLDTLNIQNITDDVGYLDAIGRARSAQIRRDAQVAEAETKSEAAKQKWLNTQNAELAKIESEKEIARKENEQRIADAQSRRAALIAAEQAEVQALVAQAKAEVAMQEARIGQVQRRLQADVIQPAEAACRAAEEQAKGDAARIIEKGTATATALTRLAESYNASGGTGRDALLMQKLVPLLNTVSGTIGNLEVNRLTVIPGARGAAGGDAPLGAKLIDLSEQFRVATGVDLPKLMQDRLGSSGAEASKATAGKAKPPALPRRSPA